MERQVIRERGQLEEVNDYIKSNEFVGFDTETSSWLPFDGKLLAVQIGEHQKQYVIDVQTLGIDNLLPTLELLKQTTIIGHNLKFDLKWTYFYGIDLKNVYDTFLMECILTTGLDKSDRKLSLADCVRKYAGASLDKSVRNSIMLEGFTYRVVKYCAEDVKYLTTRVDG